jgi:hypothetical protein
MSLNFSYNEFTDILTVEGIDYSGRVFREWSEHGLKVNEPFFIFRRKDGVLDLGRGQPPQEARPTAARGRR